MNLVTVTGPDTDRLKAFVKSRKNPFDFQKIRPCPPELLNRISPFRPEGEETEDQAEALRQDYLQRFGADTWYDWCLTHWGTKWNSYEHWDEPGYDYRFDTAWSPPIPLYARLTERFRVTLTVIDHDEGGCFCTERVFQEGKLVRERNLEGDDLAAIETRRWGDLPADFT